MQAAYCPVEPTFPQEELAPAEYVKLCETVSLCDKTEIVAAKPVLGKNQSASLQQ